VVEEYQPELVSLIASWWTPNIHIIHEGSCYVKNFLLYNVPLEESVLSLWLP